MQKGLKILNALVIASLLFFLAIILVVYAFLPENPGILFSDDGVVGYQISRNQFFYSAFLIFMIIQIAGFLFRSFLLNKLEGLNLSFWYYQTWFSINIFITLMVAFVGLANNTGNYTFQSVIPLAYIGPVLLFLSLISLPIYLISKKR